MSKFLEARRTGHLLATEAAAWSVQSCAVCMSYLTSYAGLSSFGALKYTEAGEIFLFAAKSLPLHKVRQQYTVQLAYPSLLWYVVKSSHVISKFPCLPLNKHSS